MTTWNEHMATWQAAADRRAPQQLVALSRDDLLLSTVAAWDRVCPQRRWNKTRPPRNSALAWSAAFQALSLDDVCEALTHMTPNIPWPLHHAALLRAVNAQLVLPDGTISRAAQGYLNKLASEIAKPKKKVDTPEAG